ncbi:MAG: Ku protein [Bacteriovorax sp.]|nr:Ku protein [Bacteriovorax sp.]
MRSNIWKGALSFGLLNIPVRLMKAEEEKTLHFSMLDEKDLSPIRYKKINAKTGKEVPYNRIVKGYEFKKNQYVVMNDKDFKVANVEATGTIDIENFVEQKDIDLMFLERPYYLVPEKNGEKGYFLLSEAMKKSKKVAIAKIVMRTKQHLVMIMVRGDYLVLEMMRFAHEVIEADKVDYFKDFKKVKFNPKEMSMAVDLVDGMTEKWMPEQYKDTYYTDLKKIIDKKIKGGKGKVIDYEVPEPIKASNVLDLMPLLKQSLESKKSSKKVSSKISAKVSKSIKKPAHKKRA